MSIPPNMVRVLSPMGQWGTIPAESVPSALEDGYVLESPEQARDRLLQEKYGTGSQALIAGLESAGSAATFGLSSVAERALGVDPEGMRLREEANPVASGVGTAVGIVAPAVISGGTSLLGKGAGTAAKTAAELSAPSLLAKAGSAVERAAMKALPAGESLLAKLASKGTAKAAAGAVEGLGWGAGQLVHEAALADDPSEVAESALATLGSNALLFGAIGGATGVLGGLTEHLVGKASASELGAKLGEWLKDYEVGANVKAAGGIKSDLKKAIKSSGAENLEAKALEMRDLGLLRGPMDTPRAVLSRAEAMMSADGPAIGKFLGSVDDAAGAPLADGLGMVERAREKIVAPLTRNPLTKSAGKQLDDILDGYSARWAPRKAGAEWDLGGVWAPPSKGGATLQDLHAVRRELDDRIRGLAGEMSPLRNETTAALNEFRGMVSGEIKDSIKRAGADLEQWTALNRRFEVASTAKKFAQAGLDRAGNNLVSLTEGMSGLAGAMSGGPALGAASAAGWALARRQGSATLGWMARGLREMLEGEAGAAVTNKTAKMIAAERMAAASVVPGPFGATPLPQPIGAAASRAPETAAALAVLQAANAKTDKAIGDVVVRALEGVGKSAPAAGLLPIKEHAERVRSVQRAAADLGSLQQRLADNSSDVAEHAPSVAGALDVASARVVAFLASKVPHGTADTPLQKGHEASAAERARFDRYYSAATDPIGTLGRIADGSASPEDIQTIQALYPALVNKLRAKTMDQLGKLKKPPSYRARLTLSALTGVALDKSLEPQNILRVQSVYRQPSARNPMDMAGPSRGSARADKLTVAKRTMTPLNASATRGT